MAPGNHFRLIVNAVEAVAHLESPEPPVARAVWECKPDFKTALAAWMYAGGAHHTVYSYALRSEHMEDSPKVAGIELVITDPTPLREPKSQPRQNDLTHTVAQGSRS